MFQQLKREFFGSYFVCFESLCFVQSLVMAIKKAFFCDYFLLGLPKLSSLTNENLNIIGQIDINQFFSCNIRYFIINSVIISLIYSITGGCEERSLIKISL